MPIYEYRCDKGHSFEVMQRMADEPLTECTICGARVQRVFHPVAVHFKGKGFYTTDYGKGGPSTDGKADSTDATPAKSDSKTSTSDSGSGSDSGSSKEADSKKSSTKSPATD
jgi:putative FmdB family regulatory protein